MLPLNTHYHVTGQTISILPPESHSLSLGFSDHSHISETVLSPFRQGKEHRDYFIDFQKAQVN